MSILLWAGVASLGAASIAALRRMWRSGESRWALLSALLAFLGAQLVVAFGVAAESLPAVPLVVAERLTIAASCALGLLVTFAYTRTASERDRAEMRLWESMEVVRALGRVPEGQPGDGGLGAELERLLDLGRRYFGAEIGIVSRIHGDRYEVVAVRAPHGVEPTRGAVLALSDTFCERVVATQRALSFTDVETPGWSDHPARLALGFGSYLGAPVRADGDCFGTLCFASFGPARTALTATQRDLAGLLAQRAGAAVEHAATSAANAAADGKGAEKRRRSAATDAELETTAEHHRARSHRPAPPGRRKRGAAAPGTAPALDVDDALDRMKGLLAKCAGEKIELAMRLSSGLRAARSPGVAFRPLVLDLVRHAVAALPAGGRLELATDRVGPAAFSSDAGTAPAGFVTLAVRVTGEDVAADGTAAHFGAAPRVGPDGEPGRWVDAVRSISEIERILHDAGGDLSVAVEPGRGSTCTVFLPELSEPAQTAAAGPPATAADRHDAAEGPASGTQLSFLA